MRLLLKAFGMIYSTGSKILIKVIIFTVMFGPYRSKWSNIRRYDTHRSIWVFYHIFCAVWLFSLPNFMFFCSWLRLCGNKLCWSSQDKRTKSPAYWYKMGENHFQKSLNFNCKLNECKELRVFEIKKILCGKLQDRVM